MTVRHTYTQGEPAASPAGPAIIHAAGVVKTYDTGKVKVQALRGVSLTIGRGEMVAIMGPSGCGKTTLLNCLSGLDDIDSGRVSVDGTDLSTMSDNEKTEYRARHMGFVFQFYNLLPVLSAVENVELPLLVSGVSAREARRRALEALDRVHLRDWADHKPAELSGGQRQRVTIARALAGDPRILILDDALSSVDAETERAILDRIRVHFHGRTILVGTHRLPSVERADLILVLDRGRLVEHGTHAELLNRHGLYAYLWDQYHRRAELESVHSARFTVGEDPIWNKP